MAYEKKCTAEHRLYSREKRDDFGRTCKGDCYETLRWFEIMQRLMAEKTAQIQAGRLQTITLAMRRMAGTCNGSGTIYRDVLREEHQCSNCDREYSADQKRSFTDILHTVTAFQNAFETDPRWKFDHIRCNPYPYAIDVCT